MGNIRIFETPGLERPLEEALNTTAGNARRVGQFYNQQAGALEQLGSDKAAALRSVGKGLGTGGASLGDVYVNQLDHEQISTGMAKGSQLMENLSDQWHKIATDPNIDPNDPNIKTKFMQDVFEPALQDFKGSDFFTTDKSQKYADELIGKFRQQMEKQTSSDMSELAAVRTKVNAQTSLNSFSSMVATDPSKLDFALDAWSHGIDAKVSSSPTLDVSTGARVRGELGLKGAQDLVRSAAIANIQKNPNFDLDAFQKKYGEYISGPEMKMFQKTAQVQARSDAATAKQAALADRQLADQNMHAGSNQVIADNVSIDPQSGRPVVNPKFFSQTLDLARKNPGAPSASATVRTMLDWGESQQNKETKAVDDPAVKTGLMDRMFSPDHPTTTIDLMKAHAEGKLSNQSFTAMKQLSEELAQSPLKGPIWTTTTAAVKERLIRTDIKTGDKIGADNYSAFMQDFLPKYIAKSRAGTLEPNALNLNDPNSMISKAIGPYQASMQTRLRTSAAPTGPAERNDSMPAIPPPAQRPAGSIYETPRGKMKWTGTGWVAP